jgi:hypothetical protein
MYNISAALTTFLKPKVLTIQTIKNKLTLSSVSLLTIEMYKVVELRSGEIAPVMGRPMPVTDNV